MGVSSLALLKINIISHLMYLSQAAEIYKQCGENRLERLHRIACADCQRGQDAYASAAAEYTRAAQLAATSDETDNRRRNETYQLFKSASDAWMAVNEKGKAGQCLVNAAIGLLIGYDEKNTKGISECTHSKIAGNYMRMEKRALKAMEEAVEAHVPDPLNRYASYRESGVSDYIDGSNTSTSLILAKQNIVTSAYAHENVIKALHKFVDYGEFQSALYAAGAVSALLEAQDATISLHRAYLTETILQLNTKDVVAADKFFLEVHLQRNSYLRSRECKLAEDLIRAVKSMDQNALDTAKLENRSALANLDPTLRLLVMNLRLSGPSTRTVSKKMSKTTVANKKAIAPTSTPDQNDLQGEELAKAMEDNFSEMDKIMEDMGLDGADDGDNKEDELEEDGDDDIDLR